MLDMHRFSHFPFIAELKAEWYNQYITFTSNADANRQRIQLNNSIQDPQIRITKKYKALIN